MLFIAVELVESWEPTVDVFYCTVSLTVGELLDGFVVSVPVN